VSDAGFAIFAFKTCKRYYYNREISKLQREKTGNPCRAAISEEIPGDRDRMSFYRTDARDAL
jgi:hypothetical protein